MRRLLVPAAFAMVLVLGGGGPGWAAPAPAPSPAVPSAAARPALPDGWSVERGKLTWRADRQVPAGDAAVEFWSGERRLGVPDFTPDHTTFSLDLSRVWSLDDLSVRSGGRRIDRAPQAARRGAAPVVIPPAPLPEHSVDPGIKGPYRTVEGEYRLADVTLPGYAAPVEMRAVVVAPKGAPGNRPLALFLQGRHTTCFAGEQDSIEWPCPAGMQPIPSHRGYLQAQELLASQGWVTVSIAANGINGQDGPLEDAGAQGRSSLVRQHLGKWADWSGTGRAGAPAVVRAAPRADLGRVFLMGHSRGGEGVSRAAMDSLTPPPAAQEGYPGEVRWTIRGLLLIGPTIFGHNPVPDVPSATILPGCDGDVSDLQGQMFIDETRGVSRGRALHSSLYMVGANHNFFNTEWTPGQSAAPSIDDWSWWDENDAVCGTTAPTRLSAAQQQSAGATYIAAAARLFDGDERMLPLLDGSGVSAASAAPARVLSHALGAARTAALLPDPSVTATGGARICEQVTADPSAACLVTSTDVWPAVHFATYFGAVPEPGRHAADLTWTAAGTPLTLAPRRPMSLGAARGLALRLIVPPNSTGTRFTVAVTDPAGRRAVLGEVRADGLPGTGLTSSHWAQELRVPLRGFRGEVAKLELTPRTANGRAWLLDAWGRGPDLPDPRPVALPRVDLGGLVVDEGDSGTKTYQVPLRITGRGGGRLSLTVLHLLTGESRSWQTTVEPDQRVIEVPVEVAGDTRYAEGEATYVLAKSQRGFVVGDYAGAVEIRNDDPMPTMSLAPVADTVAEGGTLSWRLTLSAAAESWLVAGGWPEAPATGTELSTLDVHPDWFRAYSGEPEPERPLSASGLSPYVFLEAGETSADIVVPTVPDDVAEGPEVVDLQFGDELGKVTGTVTD